MKTKTKAVKPTIYDEKETEANTHSEPMAGHLIAKWRRCIIWGRERDFRVYCGHRVTPR